MGNVYIISRSHPLGEGPLYSADLVPFIPGYDAYRDRGSEIVESIYNEVTSPYYSNMVQTQPKNYVENLLVDISTNLVKASILSELTVNKIFGKVPLLGWKDTSKLSVDEIDVEQKIVFELLAKIEIMHSGILPFHSYGNIDGNMANKNGMRFLNDDERSSVAKIDWLTIFLNAGERNNSDFSRKPSVATFIPILLHETYLSLVRNKLSKKDALRIVMTALAPIKTLGSLEKYQAKIFLLEEMGKKLPIGSEEKEDFDELLSMYSSSADSIWVPKG